MDNIKFVTLENPDQSTTEHAIITHDDGSFLSMPKSVYDTLPSELSTPTTPQAGA